MSEEAASREFDPFEEHLLTVGTRSALTARTSVVRSSRMSGNSGLSLTRNRRRKRQLEEESSLSACDGLVELFNPNVNNNAGDSDKDENPPVLEKQQTDPQVQHTPMDVSEQQDASGAQQDDASQQNQPGIASSSDVVPDTQVPAEPAQSSAVQQVPAESQVTEKPAEASTAASAPVQASAASAQEEPRTYGQPITEMAILKRYPYCTPKPRWRDAHLCPLFEHLKQTIMQRSTYMLDLDGHGRTYITAQVQSVLAFGENYVLVGDKHQKFAPKSYEAFQEAERAVWELDENAGLNAIYARFPYIPFTADLPIVELPASDSKHWDFTPSKFAPEPPTEENSRIFMYAVSNIRYSGKTYAANCRHPTYSWNEHPWCEVCLAQAGVPTCNSPDVEGVDSECYICRVMSNEQRNAVRTRHQEALDRKRDGETLEVRSKRLPLRVVHQTHADYWGDKKKRNREWNPAWNSKKIGFCRPKWSIPVYLDTMRLANIPTENYAKELVPQIDVFHRRYREVMKQTRATWDLELVKSAMQRTPSASGREEPVATRQQSTAQGEESEDTANPLSKTKGSVTETQAKSKKKARGKKAAAAAAKPRTVSGKRKRTETLDYRERASGDEEDEEEVLGTQESAALQQALVDSLNLQSGLETEKRRRTSSSHSGQPVFPQATAEGADDDVLFVSASPPPSPDPVRRKETPAAAASPASESKSPGSERTPASERGSSAGAKSRTKKPVPPLRIPRWNSEHYDVTPQVSVHRRCYGGYTDATRAAMKISRTARDSTELGDPLTTTDRVGQSLVGLDRVNYVPIRRHMSLINRTLGSYRRDCLAPTLHTELPVYMQEFPESMVDRLPELKVADDNKMFPDDSDFAVVTQTEISRLEGLFKALLKLHECDDFMMVALCDRMLEQSLARPPGHREAEPFTPELKVVDALRENVSRRDQLLGESFGIITAVRRRDIVLRQDYSPETRSAKVSQPFALPEATPRPRGQQSPQFFAQASFSPLRVEVQPSASVQALTSPWMSSSKKRKVNPPRRSLSFSMPSGAAAQCLMRTVTSGDVTAQPAQSAPELSAPAAVQQQGAQRAAVATIARPPSPPPVSPPRHDRTEN